MKKRFARGISFILSAAMVLSTLNIPVSAAGTGSYTDARIMTAGVSQAAEEESGDTVDIGDTISSEDRSNNSTEEAVSKAEEVQESAAEAETDTEAITEASVFTEAKANTEAEISVNSSQAYADADAKELQAGLWGEIFNTDAYRGGSIELFNFDNKTGEQVFPALSGQNLRPVFEKYNGNKGDEQFATARFTGKLNVEKAGKYTFYGWGDDGFRVWIDGNLAIDFWVQEWEKEQTSKQIELTQGLHDIKVEYLQGWGGAVMKLMWESKDAGVSKEIIPEKAYSHEATAADAGLTAQIYKVKGTPSSISSYGFAGEPVMKVLPFMDGGNSLKDLISASNGSSEYAAAIIHGYITPEETGDYEFVMSGDDAFRFWLKDELKINSWKLNSSQTKTSQSVHMEKGFLYKIRIDYAQADKDANLNLSWKKDGGDVQVIPKSCYRQAAKAIQGEASEQEQHGLLAEVYGDIYLEEKKGEILAPVLDKSFTVKKVLSQFNGDDEYGSLRFSGELQAEEEGDYTFYLIGDDGFRLWLNGEIAIDFWESKWDKQQVSKPVHLNAGKNDIRIEYFQGYGGAYILLEWMKPGAVEKEVVPSENLFPANTKKGLIGELYQGSKTDKTKLAEFMASEVSKDQLQLNTLLEYYGGDKQKSSSVSLSGKFKPSVTGDCSLVLGASGKYSVSLDGEELIAADGENEYKETKSIEISLEKGNYYNLTIEAENLNVLEEMNLYLLKDGQKQLITAEQFYAPETMWYEGVTAREKLYQLIKEAESLVKNTAAGTDIGQIPKEFMDKMSSSVTEARTIAEDFDAVAAVMSAETQKITDAVGEFKLNVVHQQQGQELTSFNNALYQGQDPFITYQDGYYYFVSSSNDPGHNKMYVSKSKSLLDQGEKVRIFDFNDSKSRIFAPEMFFIDGKWYIYYCADAKEYNWRHMACVMESVTDDPQGDWIDRGVLYTGMEIQNPDEFAQGNDFTVFQYRGQLYACWGSMEKGVEAPAIARMESPIKITEERSFLPGFGGEGPRAVLNGDNLFMTVSQGDFKSALYHLGMYVFDTTKDDLLNPENWSYREDVFGGTKDVYGPARASFFKSADGTEDWMAFHSKVYPANRNAWRQVSIKKFTWNEDGSPDFGKPVSPYEFTALPSGDPGLGLAYQAENAAVSGGANKGYKGKGYLGTGYVNVTGQDGEKVTFTVNAEKQGDYFVRIRYANGVKATVSDTDHRGEWESDIPDITPKAGTLNLYVNAAAQKNATASFDKTETDWQHWMTNCIRVTLNKGENTLSLVKDSENTGNVYIDYITVQEAHDRSAPQTVKSSDELDTLIASVKGFAEKDYSVETWRIFHGALLSAEAVNKNAEQAVSNRYLSLEAAAKDLSKQVRITTNENITSSQGVHNSMYDIGSELTFRAKDIPGKIFAGWKVTGIELTKEQMAAQEITFMVPRIRVSAIPVYTERESYTVLAGSSVSIENAATSGRYQAGTTVKAVVTIPQGKEFMGWDVLGITLTESQKKAVVITFVMPENEVSLNVIMKDIPVPEKPKYRLNAGAYIVITNPAKDQMYTAGTTIHAKVSVPSGKLFREWKATGVTLTASQKKSASITFAMPNGQVNLEAVFDIQKKTQTIKASGFKKTDGDKAFYLKASASGKGKLTYKSDNTKIAKVDSKGKVTIKASGIVNITITAAENTGYKKAVKKITITVSPKKVTGLKVSSKKSKTAIIMWKKVKGSSGYQLTYSTDKRFKKNVKKLEIRSGNTSSRTIKSLKGNKKYYVKIRAYQSSGKKKIYGSDCKYAVIRVKR